MRAVDTNVLVRLIARDDPRQVAAAEEFVKNGAWVSVLALAETTWVLSSIYELDPASLATAIEMLLEQEVLVLQDHDAVARALKRFRAKSSLDFSDCLMLELAQKAGHLPLGTFDRALGRMDGVRTL